MSKPDEVEINIARLKMRIENRVREIKADFLDYIGRETDPVRDGVEVSSALLELAFERYLHLHENAEEVGVLVNSALRRAVDRWKTGMN